MSRWEIVLQFSREARAWAGVFMPAFMTFLAGWHLKQPRWIRKDGSP